MLLVVDLTETIAVVSLAVETADNLTFDSFNQNTSGYINREDIYYVNIN